MSRAISTTARGMWLERYVLRAITAERAAHAGQWAQDMTYRLTLTVMIQTLIDVDDELTDMDQGEPERMALIDRMIQRWHLNWHRTQQAMQLVESLPHNGSLEQPH